jgi:hypothetical protein
MLVSSIDSPTEPTLKFVRSEDEIAYGLWLKPHVFRFSRTVRPLYHYTTGTGLIEIIKSAELWSTQLSCLNDASEFLYPTGMVLNRVQLKLTSPVSTGVRLYWKR